MIGPVLTRARVCVALTYLLILASCLEIPLEEDIGNDGVAVSSSLEWLGSDCEARPYVIITPCNNNSQLSLSWLDDAAARNFDIVALYYGDPNDPFNCPQCVAILRQQSVKWHLVYRLSRSPSWPELLQRYRYFMIPDDDLFMSTHVINTAFAVLDKFNVSIGQPSLCSHPNSYSFWPILYQDTSVGLHYTAFIENMAPILSRELITEVAPLLENAYIGYGVDYLWASLLDYRPGSMAVVDKVCMFHPAVQKSKHSIHARPHHHLNWTAHQEYEYFMGNWNIGWDKWTAKGFKKHPNEVVLGFEPLDLGTDLESIPTYCPQHVVISEPEAAASGIVGRVSPTNFYVLGLALVATGVLVYIGTNRGRLRSIARPRRLRSSAFPRKVSPSPPDEPCKTPSPVPYLPRMPTD